jgi:hypothetical protein
MASKMPTSNLSSYIENLPASTRRRFADQNVVKKRTAVALGSGGFKRSAWNSSSNEKSADAPSDTNENHLNLTTVVEVNNSRQA